ncbi:unnamed protein product [Ectocarpus fasciculatus]
MRLQAQMLLSVASGSLGPAATVVRAFVPAASTAVRVHSAAASTRGAATAAAAASSTTRLRAFSAGAAGPSVDRAAISSWGRASSSRRPVACSAESGGKAGASGAAGEGGGGGGGRASAAVLQDAEKRGGAARGGSPAAVEKLDLKPPKGTRDVFPEDMRLRNWLFGHWRGVASSFGFEEYDAPVLESESLYTRKSGEEVTQQLYCFEDKGGRRVSLRPEMTPSLARMVMAKRKSLTLPVKWFSIPQCWRYERMTRGRRREHYQWNMDIWGVSGVSAEAELLGAMVTFFERVGLRAEDVGIRVNSRGVLTEVLHSLGVPGDKHTATCVLVDKLDKVPLEAVAGDLAELGLEETSVKRLLEVMELRDMEGVEAFLGKESPAAQELRKLFALAESYGISDWLVLDCSVVRGLAYYTGTVFEAFDRRGKLRAIAGGGRYDALLESFGGEALPAAGFGFGDAVIVELLSDRGLLPKETGPGVTAVVFGWDDELQGAATEVAASLRREGVSVDLVLQPRKTKANFKHATRVGATYVVMVAPSEWKAGKVSVKDLRTSDQKELPVGEVASHILAGDVAISKE